MLERTCMGCNRKKTKKELIRLVIIEDKLVIDNTYKVNSRGAYICNDIICFDKCMKNKRIERSLKHSFTQENYNQIRSTKFERK